MSGVRRTCYRRRYKPAKGACLYEGVDSGPRRIMVTLDPEAFRRLSGIASERQVPLSTILRDAAWAYLMPLPNDAASESIA